MRSLKIACAVTVALLGIIAVRGALVGRAASSTLPDGVSVTTEPTQLPGYVWTNFRLPGLDAPGGIAFGPDGKVWMTIFSPAAIATMNVDGSGYRKFSDPFPGSAPWMITAGSDGNMWFTDMGNGMIGRVTPTGNITEFALPGSPGGGWAILSAADGRVYFTTQGGPPIGKLPLPADIGTTYPSVPYVGWFSPNDPLGTLKLHRLPSDGMGLTTGPDGSVWFAYTVHFHDVLRSPLPFDSGVGRISRSGTLTQYPFPKGHSVSAIGLGSDGDVFTSDHGWVWQPQLPAFGRFSTTDPLGTLRFFDQGIVPAMNHFASITRARDGNVYVTDDASHHAGRWYGVYQVTPDGTITEIPGPRLVAAPAYQLLYSGGFNSSGVQQSTIGPDGDLWTQAQLDSDIVRLTIPRTTAGTTASHLTATSPTAVCSRRFLTIHVPVPQGSRVLRATATLGGRSVALRRRGHYYSGTLDVRRRVRGTIVVRTRLRLASGRVLAGRRDYHPCAQGR